MTVVAPKAREASESCTSSWNLVTVHPPASYTGLKVVRASPEWLEWIILGEVGRTVVARGGEEAYPYVTADGVRAEGFVLRAGDRATIVRDGLPASLVEWRIERAHRRASSGSRVPETPSRTR